jgi:parvulin-like peptidyl-prolyl isomerase
LAEALELGYADRPEVARDVRQYETQLLVQRYLSEVVAAGVTVSEEEIQARYDARPNAYHRPPRLHLGQITVTTREEAEEVADLLRRGTELAWLARRRSTDRFASKGGDRGWEVPRPGGGGLDDELLRAQPGDVFGPYSSGDSHVVLQLTARQEQGRYPLEEVSEALRGTLFDEKSRTAIHDVINKLRERASIEIDRDQLASMLISGSTPE